MRLHETQYETIVQPRGKHGQCGLACGSGFSGRLERDRLWWQFGRYQRFRYRGYRSSWQRRGWGFRRESGRRWRNLERGQRWSSHHERHWWYRRKRGNCWNLRRGWQRRRSRLRRSDVRWQRILPRAMQWYRLWRWHGRRRCLAPGQLCGAPRGLRRGRNLRMHLRSDQGLLHARGRRGSVRLPMMRAHQLAELGANDWAAASRRGWRGRGCSRRADLRWSLPTLRKRRRVVLG